MKAFLSFLRRAFCGFSKETVYVSDKTLADIKYWLEHNGVRAETAAQIKGFLAAYGIELGPVRLCNYGFVYCFEDFMKWWKEPRTSYEPVENDYAIMWDDDRRKAIIAVFMERKEGRFVDQAGVPHDNACRFYALADYRMILNEPDDCELPLPLEFLAEAAKERKELKKSKSGKKVS